MLIAEHGGDTMLLRIGMMRALSQRNGAAAARHAKLFAGASVTSR
jgi:hypothetical protein